MWLFFPFGFYSVVYKKPDSSMQRALKEKGWEFGESKPAEDYLCLRVRDLEDLNRLKSKMTALQGQRSDTFSPILGEGFGTDYQGRIWIRKECFGKFSGRYISEIDYRNFKNQAAIHASKRHKSAFTKVWSVLWDLVAPKPVVNRSKPSKMPKKQIGLTSFDSYFSHDNK